jgi:2-succinyl-5-enolpyruvyl-6-hydroxy-3-cyclohexene-1-carboxylate synthase
VAVACTSGSAALNYAPAIAEAYYRKVPLLVITADRPPELIDRGYGQTIRQRDVYQNYIKAGFELPVEIEDEETLKEAERTINEAINLTQFPEPGPVHINIPFREPLYGTMQEVYDPEVTDFEGTEQDVQQFISELAEAWNKHTRVMIIVGQQNRDERLNTLLSEYVVNKNVVLMSETTSNLYHEKFIDCIDNVVSTIKEEAAAYHPELLITFGGQVVSKMVKKFLKDHPPVEHWHISPLGERMDTYFKLKKVIPAQPAAVFESLWPLTTDKPDDFAIAWQERKAKVVVKKEQYLQQIPFSDLKVFEFLLDSLPAQINLHLGNSTPVRYNQLFGSDPRFHYFSNRGVSGIDGQISTAAGTAFVSDRLNVLITGDLGFFYDSNGLMNKYLAANFKIIVINNGGGGIFRFIDGPSTTEHLEDFFEARHNRKAEKIAEAFEVKYFRAENQEQLQQNFSRWMSEQSGPALLEIFTPAEKNAEILLEYFRYLK